MKYICTFLIASSLSCSEMPQSISFLTVKELREINTLSCHNQPSYFRPTDHEKYIITLLDKIPDENWQELYSASIIEQHEEKMYQIPLFPLKKVGAGRRLKIAQYLVQRGLPTPHNKSARNQLFCSTYYALTHMSGTIAELFIPHLTRAELTQCIDAKNNQIIPYPQNLSSYQDTLLTAIIGLAVHHNRYENVSLHQLVSRSLPASYIASHKGILNTVLTSPDIFPDLIKTLVSITPITVFETYPSRNPTFRSIELACKYKNPNINTLLESLSSLHGTQLHFPLTCLIDQYTNNHPLNLAQLHYLSNLIEVVDNKFLAPHMNDLKSLAAQYPCVKVALETKVPRDESYESDDD